LISLFAVALFLSGCITVAPGLPFQRVYLHRPDTDTFEFIVCSPAQGSTIIVEFHQSGDVLVGSWRADSDSVREFAEGDTITTAPAPDGFVSDQPFVEPDQLRTISFYLGSGEGESFESDISGTFRKAEVSGTSWRDQTGTLVPPQC
jgi:hypothetical protein